MRERDLEFWNEDEWADTICGWPSAVQSGFASRLRIVQLGGFPTSRDKPLKGFSISLREMWHRSGQRIIYTVEYAALTNRVHVLDAFEKDAREGSTMRTSDKKRIETRVKRLKAEMDSLKLSMANADRGRRH